jgi:hypothetical protein
MIVTRFEIITDVREVHPEKALSRMCVTEFGMITPTNTVHPAKAHLPIFVTESGIVTVTSNVRRRKAFSPISPTELGIAIEVYFPFGIELLSIPLDPGGISRCIFEDVCIFYNSVLLFQFFCSFCDL